MNHRRKTLIQLSILAAKKLKREAMDRAIRLGKELEKVREDRNTLKDQMSDYEKEKIFGKESRAVG